eukprot:gene59007-78733_t
MVFGDFLKKAVPKKATDTITVQFLPKDISIEAKIGQPISAVAVSALVDIKYKCKKGECGTCEVNMNGKWVKACQSTIAPPNVPGETLVITVKPEKEIKKSATFFSPKSFVDGFTNNALGVAGLVAAITNADDEFNQRMAKEKEFADKVAAAKAAKAAGQN